MTPPDISPDFAAALAVLLWATWGALIWADVAKR